MASIVDRDIGRAYVFFRADERWSSPSAPPRQPACNARSAFDPVKPQPGATASRSFINPAVEYWLHRASGFLVDGGGKDRYLAPEGVGPTVARGSTTPTCSTQARATTSTRGGAFANGGGSLGTGFLYDAGGNDDYRAGDGATSGGALGDVSVWYPGLATSGVLFDAGGNDAYQAGGSATNGGAIAGAGLLHDAGGNDTYRAGDTATNGGPPSGAARLVDVAGTDAYTAGAGATNGSGPAGIDTGRHDIQVGFYVVHVPNVTAPGGPGCCSTPWASGTPTATGQATRSTRPTRARSPRACMGPRWTVATPATTASTSSAW